MSTDEKQAHESIAGEQSSNEDILGEKNAATSMVPPKVKISQNDVIGIIGFSLYITWVFLLMLNPLLGRSSLGKDIAVDIVFFFFIGEAIASCVAWILASRLMSEAALKCVAALTAILAVAPGVCFACFPDFAALLAGAWACAGFGAVFLLSLWALFLSQLPHKKAILFPAISMFLVPMAIGTVMFLFVPEALTAAMAIIPLISVALFVYWAFFAKKVKGLLSEYDSTKPPDAKSLIRSSGAMVANGILIGFVVFAMSVSETNLLIVCVFVAMMAAAGFKVFDSLHGQTFEVASIIKILAPTVAVGFLLLPYFSIEIKIGCCVLMMFIATLNEAVCWSAVCEYTRVFRLIPFANIAFGRLGDVIGTACGYLVGRLALGTSFVAGPIDPLVLCIVVIMFSFAQAFFFKDNYTPFSEHHGSESESNEPSRHANCLPGVSRSGWWKRKCKAFAEYYQLTPRQEEMLIMLAKGYSTSYMRDTLIVSEHTVKAHIYNIYRKIDVHSRQELIERLEDFQWDEQA